MNTRKLALAIYAGIIIVVTAFSTLTMNASAQTTACGLPGQPPCPPSGGGGQKQKPPLVFPTDTPTPTYNWIFTAAAETLTAQPTTNPMLAAPAPITLPSATATTPPWYATFQACWHNAYLTSEASFVTPPPNTLPYENTADAVGYICYQTLEPTLTPLSIPPVAGPKSPGPGVINVILAVLIIIVCFGGGIFFLRRGFRPPTPNMPNSTSDGANQFYKIMPNQNQTGSQFDAANQWRKIGPDQSKPGPTEGGSEEL